MATVTGPREPLRRVEPPQRDERPLWQTVCALYSCVALVVALVIVLAFVMARIFAGAAY